MGDFIGYFAESGVDLGVFVHLPLCVYLPNHGLETVVNRGCDRGFTPPSWGGRWKGSSLACVTEGHRMQSAAGFPPSFNLVLYPALYRDRHLIEGQSWVHFLHPRTHMSRVFIWSLSAGHKGSSVCPRTCRWSCVWENVCVCVSTLKIQSSKTCCGYITSCKGYSS